MGGGLGGRATITPYLLESQEPWLVMPDSVDAFACLQDTVYNTASTCSQVYRVTAQLGVTTSNFMVSGGILERADHSKSS